MKKLILGTGLMLSGVTGFVGWCIAVTQTVQEGARSFVFACFDLIDWIVAAPFIIMMAAGLITAVRAAGKDE